MRFAPTESYPEDCQNQTTKHIQILVYPNFCLFISHQTHITNQVKNLLKLRNNNNITENIQIAEKVTKYLKKIPLFETQL